MNGVDFDVVARGLSSLAEGALLSDRRVWRKRASHGVGFSPNTIRFFPGRTRVGLIGWTKSLSLRIFLHANNPPMVNIPSPITRNATTSVGDSFVLKKFIISLLLLELLVLEFCGDVLVVEAMVLSSHGARLSVR